jgi:hypothetical protein
LVYERETGGPRRVAAPQPGGVWKETVSLRATSGDAGATGGGRAANERAASVAVFEDGV